ncbi:hypothetical protein FRC18_000781, partial [Serendipita sp. 400]
MARAPAVSHHSTAYAYKACRIPGVILSAMHFLAALSLFFFHCLPAVLGALLSNRGAVVSRCGNELTQDEVAKIERKIDRDSKRLGKADFDSKKRLVPFIVDVVWHVIYDKDATNSGYLSDGTISDSLLALNNHYNGTGFIFKYSPKNVTHIHNAYWFYNAKDGSHAERQMKTALAVEDPKVLNLYSVALSGGLLGYATFPWDYSENKKLDGVVFSHKSVPGSDVTDYNEGKTLTHEVGHWLGLFHVFEGGSCTGEGDSVDDTPPQSTSTEGCPEVASSSCPGNGGDSIH